VKRHRERPSASHQGSATVGIATTTPSRNGGTVKHEHDPGTAITGFRRAGIL
jgi:hypothetical protein